MPATSQAPIRIRPQQAVRPGTVSRVLVVQEDVDTRRALAGVIAWLGRDRAEGFIGQPVHHQLGAPLRLASMPAGA